MSVALRDSGAARELYVESLHFEQEEEEERIHVRPIINQARRPDGEQRLSI